jgi:HEAT repeat protein
MRPRLGGLALLLLAAVGPVLLWDAAFGTVVRRDAQALLLPEGPERQRAEAELRAFGAAAVPKLVRDFAVPAGAVGRGARGGGTSTQIGPLTLPIMNLLRQQGAVVVPALVASLDDDDPDVRHYAGLTLTWIGAPALPAVLDVLEHGAAAQRTTAAWILSLMGAEGVPARPALQRALDDPDSDVRHMARFADGQLAPGNEAFWRLVQRQRESTR